VENWLSTLLAGQLFAFMLIFSRLGTAFVSMPGFGEVFVSPRIRLMLALTISALLTPILGPKLPPQPANVFALTLLVGGEVIYGALLGLLGRLIISTVETAGMMIAMQISLSNAFVFNPAMAAQGSLIGALLGVLAIVMLFATDMHHLMLLAVVDSYTVFTPGAAVPFGDIASFYSQAVAKSFLVATQLAAPFIVMGLIFYIGLGVISRLMPQLQIFFIAIPFQIYLGFMLLGLMLSATMLAWLSYAQDSFAQFLGG
jgi:flagellar biosynthesis protein FliR